MSKGKLKFAVGLVVTAGLMTLCYRSAPRLRLGSTLELQEPARPRVRLFALGDTGTGELDQLQVAAAMERRCLGQQSGEDFAGILLLGDNFYSEGVLTVDDPQWQTKIEKPYGSPCLANGKIWPVLGNHDYHQNPAAQIEYSKDHPRWQMPHRFYGVNFGRLLAITAEDTNFPDICFSRTLCATDFLRSRLMAHGSDAKVTWNIVMAHHPLSSASVKYPDRIWGHTLFFKSLVCDHADVYVSGHGHHMEHRRLADCPANLFISGGGGGDLYGVKEGMPESQFVANQNGFLELLVDEKEIVATFVSKQGEEIYRTVMTKKKNSGDGFQ